MKTDTTRLHKPKQLRAIQTSRHFRLIHSRHTGHIRSHHTTSYPMLAMIVLCVGVFLSSWTRAVTADASYNVHVRVAGPAPTVAATISSPSDGSRFSDVPVTVTGTCPTNTYVSLFRNNVFSGVSLCDGTGNWQVSTDLFVGVNQLIARDYNFTDIAGPDSSPITVNYQPPVVETPPTETPTSTVSQSPSSASGVSGSSANPLLLKTDFTFVGYYVDKPSSWEFGITGGTAPYAIEVEWGDGTRELVSRPKAGPVSLTHIYHKAGGYHGSYTVKISTTDAAGNQTFLQLLVIINDPPTKNVAGSLQSSGGGGGIAALASGSLNRLIKYVWPSYGLVVLMLLSFWLGELREIKNLKPRPRKIRHA